MLGSNQSPSKQISFHCGLVNDVIEKIMKQGVEAGVIVEAPEPPVAPAPQPLKAVE